MQPESPQNEHIIKSLLTRIWNALYRRPFMKLSAVLIAIVFWAVVIASDPNLMREKTILNAPVTVTGQDLRSKGLIVMDDLTSGTITVKMRVEVKQADYANASAETITPRLDLSSQITQVGKQRVYFSLAPNAMGKALSFEPEYVELEVEPLIPRSRVPVVVEPTGESATPLWYSTPIADPQQVAISGPKSFVDQVQRAVVKLPLSSLSASRTHDSISALLELQDASGNPISSPLIRVTNDSITVDSVRIDMDVYPVRDIPVQVDSAVTGTPAHGYILTDVRVVPDSVAIAAPQDVLDELDTLYVSTPLDISGLTESTTATATLRAVTGTVHTTLKDVTIEADIQPATHVHTYINLPVSVVNLDPTFTAKLSHAEMDVFIQGDYDQVQGLRAGDITLYVDAAGLGEGVHMPDVLCVINGTDAFHYEPELPKVTLTLKQNGETMLPESVTNGG